MFEADFELLEIMLELDMKMINCKISIVIIIKIMIREHSIFDSLSIYNYLSLNFDLKLQECGPRFTLKLISLQHGTFDTKGGEYEWVHKVIYLLNKLAGQIMWHNVLSNSVHFLLVFLSFQPEMDTSRRRFFL